MSEPIGLMGGDDRKYRKLLSGRQAPDANAKTPSIPQDDSRPSSSLRTRPFTGFERERATYAYLKPVLLERAAGQFVAVVGEDYAGPETSFDEAERSGYRQFGIGPLYIKQILAEEPATEITRDIGPKKS